MWNIVNLQHIRQYIETFGEVACTRQPSQPAKVVPFVANTIGDSFNDIQCDDFATPEELAAFDSNIEEEEI